MRITIEEAVALVSFLGAIGSAVLFLWRIFSAITRAELKQQELQDSIETIKKEVTRNGGGSIKDLVLKLDKTCERMEIRQRIIDQRSKAALHYQERCLFETDKRGNMVWANDRFYQNTIDYGDISGGLDWVAVVHEEQREEFLIEFNSCIKMGRRIDIETVSVDSRKLHFIGYPYRVGRGNHEGFLIHMQIREN
jgi:hypothetical protein